MNISIFSGGTGSTQLIKGIKKYANKKVHINNILNLYDDGKSTGMARKACDVLGPSDMRKCQYSQYLSSVDNPDNNVVDLFTKRFDLPKDGTEDFCLDFLTKLGFDSFKAFINIFFDNCKFKDICFDDFNIVNAIYAAMFLEFGYVETAQKFKDFLNITDDIVVNAYDNLYLNAILTNGSALHSEAHIVNYNNPNNPIKDIYFTYPNCSKINIAKNPEISEECLNAINDSDLIIFSSGTQWSSLIPTYITVGMYDAIKKSHAKKILVMNNEQDGDMHGIDSDGILNTLDRYLPMNDIHVLINEDAHHTLNKAPNRVINYSKVCMGNIDRKHDEFLLAYNIFKIYYNKYLDCDHYLFDFDDTIFEKSNDDSVFTNNCHKLNELSNYKDVCLVSGNSYEHVYGNLLNVFGDFLPLSFDIWADGGIVRYKDNNIVNDFSDYSVIKWGTIYDLIDTICGISNVKIEFRGHKEKDLACLSFKGLSELERKLLKAYLDMYFKTNGIENKALITGKTTVDVLNAKTDKSLILQWDDKFKFGKKVYIGDSCKSLGDIDYNISRACEKFIGVKNPSDTYIFLNTIVNYMNEKKDA